MQRFLWPRRAPRLVIGLALAGLVAAVAVAAPGGQPADLTFTPKPPRAP
jgi:hypothetical protein